VFVGSDDTTVYHLPGTIGWGSTFGDSPALLWNPEFIAAGFGEGAFSCTVTGTPGIPIAVDASTSLLPAAWLRLQTTNLTTGSLDSRDNDSVNGPARFYRIVAP